MKEYPYRCYFCGGHGEVTIDEGELTGKHSCLPCYREWEKAGRPVKFERKVKDGQNNKRN